MNEDEHPPETTNAEPRKYPTLKSIVGAAGKLPREVHGDLVAIARQERAERRRK